jgi:RNA polymerase sigma factor for flagellar operon FliA
MAAEGDLLGRGLELVRIVARSLSRRLGGRVSVDDLTGIGNLALVEVTRSWDPTRAPFHAYAKQRLEWAILDGLRRETHARSMAARAAALLASKRISAAYAEEPEPEGPTTAEEDQAALGAMLGAHAAALAVGLTAAAPDTALVGDAFPTPEEVATWADLARAVERAIRSLPEPQRSLMVRHYYEGENFDAIARDLDITRSWASRLHKRSIEAVRDAVEKPGEKPGKR